MPALYYRESRRPASFRGCCPFIRIWCKTMDSSARTRCSTARTACRTSSSTRTSNSTQTSRIHSTDKATLNTVTTDNWTRWTRASCRAINTAQTECTSSLTVKDKAVEVLVEYLDADQRVREQVFVWADEIKVKLSTCWFALPELILTFFSRNNNKER